MSWLLGVFLLLGAVDPLGKVPGWVLMTPPGQVVFPAAVIARKAHELQTTAPLFAISRRLEELRGLKFHYPVRYTVKTPAGVRAFLEGEIDTSYPPKRMKRDTVMLEQLGLVPPGFQLKPFLIDLLGEQIAGAYDPKRDYFFVVIKESNWLSNALKSPDEEAMITLHELDHAMQNQHFQLEKKIEALARKADSDREMAFTALVEGDATSVMYDLAFAKQGMTSADAGMSMESLSGLMTALPLPGMGKFSQAPLYFQRQLLFPYMNGCDFVNSSRRVGDWDAVNLLYTNLPVSSEQIYHPEKYWAGEGPLPVDLKGKLPGWEELGRDTGGEFTARVWLEQHGVSNFKSAAEGWGGDTLVVYEKGDEHCLVWLTRWDTEADAMEFAAAARQVIGKPTNLRPKLASNYAWTVAIVGDRVLVCHNVPEALQPQP